MHNNGVFSSPLSLLLWGYTTVIWGIIPVVWCAVKTSEWVRKVFVKHATKNFMTHHNSYWVVDTTTNKRVGLIDITDVNGIDASQLGECVNEGLLSFRLEKRQ